MLSHLLNKSGLVLALGTPSNHVRLFAADVNAKTAACVKKMREEERESGGVRCRRPRCAAQAGFSHRFP
jgi:hypothetical protein